MLLLPPADTPSLCLPDVPYARSPVLPIPPDDASSLCLPVIASPVMLVRYQQVMHSAWRVLLMPTADPERHSIPCMFT